MFFIRGLSHMVSVNGSEPYRGLLMFNYLIQVINSIIHSIAKNFSTSHNLLALFIECTPQTGTIGCICHNTGNGMIESGFNGSIGLFP